MPMQRHVPRSWTLTARLTLVPLALVAGLLAPGCGPTPPCGLEICDIREADCQAQVTRATACLRGHAPVAVPIRVIKQADYVALVEMENAGVDVNLHRRWMEAYGFFGLGDPTVSVTETSRTQALWVAAYYMPGERTITIVDAGRAMKSAQAVTLLVHEVMHALQDQYVGFEAFNKRVGAVDLDRLLASKSITEGEASLVEDLAALGLFGSSEGEVGWDNVFRGWQARALEAAIDTPLPVSLAWGHFPYPFGTPYVHAAFRRQGFPGIDELYAAPPANAAQVLAGPGGIPPADGAWAEDLGMELMPDLPEAEYTPMGYDRLGAWVLEVFLRRLAFKATLPQAWQERALLIRAPTQLRADSFTFFAGKTSGETVSCWRMRFASDEMASAVLSLLREARGFPWAVWKVDRDVVVLASASSEIRALGGAALAFRPLPALMSMPAPAAASAARPGCVRRLETHDR